MNENSTKADILEIIDSLLACSRDGQKCKKCKDRHECKQYLRQCIALTLQLIVNHFDECPKTNPRYYI